jgi:predicted transcriptional regulator
MKTGTLTDVELEIMKVVWELERCTVREVYETLREQKRIAYTTVMTMMNILEKKGHLSKQKQGRAYLYEPVRAKSQVISSMVDDFVGRVFDGAARPLLLNLVKDHKITQKDLEEISQMIEEAE